MIYTRAYDDPKYPVEGGKVLVVIPVYVDNPPSKIYQHRCKDNPEVNKRYVEDKIEAVKFTLACHQHYKDSIKYDICVIDNSSPNETIQEYLKNLGKYGIILLGRENFGFSFGAYKFAWEKFRDKYDYYMFHEQDIVPCKDNWLTQIMSTFLMEKKIGAVGNTIEMRGKDNKLAKEIFDSLDTLRNREFMYNLDGTYTFTSSKILEQVEKIGGLSIGNPPYVNETVFQQQILELGYSIASYGYGGGSEYNFMTHGVSLGEDANVEVNVPLAPMLHGQTRETMKYFKEYFNWYGNK